MIKVEHANKTFSGKYGKVHALQDVSIHVEKGDIYGIIGFSGAGKSTLIRLVNGLETLDSGTVTVHGEELGSLKKPQLRKLRRKIGMVFQQFNLLESKTVYHNIALPLILEKVPKAEIDKKVKEVLQFVELEDKKDVYVSQLSGGQKQRVGIARALTTTPDILLCDEATSALDPQTTSSILALLKDINQRFNITIVIITHQMSVVREICSHVAIVKGGEVAEQGTVEDIFTHPKTAVARELLKNDVGDDGEEKRGTAAGGKEIIKSGEKIRIVFSENSAFEPVIANLILNFNEPVNILKADTKNVGGVAKGEMVLEFAPDCTKNKEMKQYLLDRGLEIEEVSEHVD